MKRPDVFRFLLAIACLVGSVPVQAQSTSVKSSPHGSLTLACDVCHNPESWSIDPGKNSFNHDQTTFPLAGRHKGVSCRECHSTLAFDQAATSCSECHDDPHQRQFGNQCAVCHSPDGWENRSQMELGHSATRFPLTGVHRGVDCLECHESGKYAGTSLECSACHIDNFTSTTSPAHREAGFPTDCQLCHTLEVVAWQGAQFTHSATFPLTQGHSASSCSDCHQGAYSNASTECFSCHSDDYNRTTDPNHAALPFPQTCESCHSPAGWTPAPFDHTLSRFQLTGAHRAVNCASCHLGDRYTGTSQECFGCHQSDYANVPDPNHSSGNYDHNCLACHTDDAWLPVSFDHNITRFPLTGAHIAADCASCHVGERYNGTSLDCYPCHRSDYETVSTPNHLQGRFDQACQTCHTTAVWSPSTFDHQTTDFALTGAHLAADCNSCHSSGLFDGLAADCFSCHQSDYDDADEPNHALIQIGHDCQTCHTTTGWEPSTFSHQVTGFPLTGAHTSVDCASCHTNGVFDGLAADCFSCHRPDYEETADPNHVAGNFNRDCLICHTTSAWAPATIDHNRTDFPLTGAHRFASCVKCHATSRYQGTSTACWSCHQVDFDMIADPSHTWPNFDRNCAVCHTTAKWSPANFDHALATFQLTGAHRRINCQSCHVGGRYSGTADECFTCHRAVYEGAIDPNHTAAQFDHNCTTCHTTEAWSPSTFDHATTDFQLTGAHQTVDCASCHLNGVFDGTPTDCYPCHQSDFEEVPDPNHQTGQFDHNCTICHSTAAWEPATFDHANTDFPLTGAHQTVDCASCHLNGQFDGTPRECYPCHQADFEEVQDPNHQTGQFDHNCTICHSTAAWDQVTFDHANTDFPLTGAHQTVDCASCHVNGQFDGTPRECYPCHQDNFEEVQDPNHQTGQFDHNCTVCHTTVAWEPASFDHSGSGFPLTGAHLAVDCASCHPNGRFDGTPTECYPCHQDDFDGVQDPNHQAAQFDHNCTICHSTEAWSPATFDHDETDFPLTGAHRQVNCASCHIDGRYEGTPTDCFPCHQADFNDVNAPNHRAAQFPHECLMCHTTNNWDSNFNHDQDFPIYAGRHRGEWNTCADCHTNPNDYRVFTCIDCHEHSNRQEVDRDHREVNNYQYNSAACYQCHPRGDEDMIRPAPRQNSPRELQR